MIFEAIISAFVNSLCALVSPFQLGGIAANILDTIMPFLYVIMYILPMKTLLVCFSVFLGLQAFRISIAIIKFITSLIPMY